MQLNKLKIRDLFHEEQTCAQYKCGLKVTVAVFTTIWQLIIFSDLPNLRLKLCAYIA